MIGIDRITHASWFSVASGAVLASLWACFAFIHLKTHLETGAPELLAFFFSETLIILFFVIRSSPRSVSADPTDWLIAGAGTTVGLLFTPGGVVLSEFGLAILTIGALGQIVSVCSLNRSFSIIPATRMIKERGAYAVVRHPLYASHALVYAGYLLLNASPMNTLVMAAFLSLVLLRISREEAHLEKSAQYRSYRETVRWRLIPPVY